MDEIEGGILSSVPPAALTLNLTRATIKMEHSRTADRQINQVDDLIICTEGRGHYLVDGEARVLERRRHADFQGQHFIGWNEQAVTYRGVAQHFTLDIYGRHNLVAQMDLKPKLSLSRWPLLEPLVRHYRQSAPPSSVTLGQHHLFMVLLIALSMMHFSDGSTVQVSSRKVPKPRSGCHESDHDDFRQSARP